MKEKNKNSLLTGLSVAVISFILLLIGVRFILKNNLLIQNIIAYLILSIILGGIAAAFIYFRLIIAVIIFLAGITVGFINLYAMFIKNLSGWGDLAGFMSFLVWIIIGFVLGLMIQLILYLYHKWKTN
jgi:hypothetical protein